MMGGNRLSWAEGFQSLNRGPFAVGLMALTAAAWRRAENLRHD